MNGVPFGTVTFTLDSTRYSLPFSDSTRPGEILLLATI